MTFPWVAGEKLLAADLNAAFGAIGTAVVVAEQGVTLAGDAEASIDIPMGSLATSALALQVMVTASGPMNYNFYLWNNQGVDYYTATGITATEHIDNAPFFMPAPTGPAGELYAAIELVDAGEADFVVVVRYLQFAS